MISLGVLTRFCSHARVPLSSIVLYAAHCDGSVTLLVHCGILSGCTYDMLAIHCSVVAYSLHCWYTLNNNVVLYSTLLHAVILLGSYTQCIGCNILHLDIYTHGLVHKCTYLPASAA